MGTPTEGDTMNTNDIDTADTDTADTDVLRQRIHDLKDRAERDARSLSRTNDDLQAAINMMRDLCDDERVIEDIRNLCSEDKDYESLVLKYEIIDLSSDYEIRVTVPVTMTIIVEGTSEDDARENVGTFLSNEVTIDVNGAEDHDFDSYDFDINNICKA